MTAITEPEAQTTLLAPLPVPFTAEDAAKSAEFAKKLQASTSGCRISHKKMGVRRALAPEQIEKMAEQFDADTSSISGSKRLFNTSDPLYKALVTIRLTATKVWKQMTVPYPEKGVRLLRKDRVAEFEQKMSGLRQDLTVAVAAFKAEYNTLVEQAREALGTLFNESDYPSQDEVDALFALDWDYPPLEANRELKDAYPELYVAEQERIRHRFEEAIKLTEDAFTSQFEKVVSHLADVLAGENEDGKPKIFRDSAVKNLQEFLEVFRSLDTGSNVALVQLVDKAQAMVIGINASDLRGEKNVMVRKSVAEGMAAIQQQLEGMVVARPGRKFRTDDDE